MKNHELDELRFQATDVENHYIDEYMAGRLSRAALLKLGTGIGMSGALLGMFGFENAYARSTAPAKAKAGGNLRVGTLQAGDRRRSCHERHAGRALDDGHHGRVPRLRRSWQPAP